MDEKEVIMKKLVSVFLAVLFALGILPVGALANSGPTYMPSAPGMQLTVDKNSPITVEHESLKFDFTTLEYNDWSPTAEVTASYEMKNPTDEALSVMMAFPTISRMSDAGIHSVHADGAPVDFEMYFGAEVKSNTERIDNTAVTEYDLSVLDLDDVLSSVLTECPPEPADGTLYTITFSAGDGIELEEDRFYANLMISPPDGTRVIFDGFGGYSYDADSGNITLDSYVYQREDVMHLYVIEGRDIGDISAEAFVAHDSKAKLDGVDIDITAQTMSLYEYVKTFGGEGFSDARYWCFLEYELDRALENYNGVAPIYDAWSGTESYPRLGMAVYTVDFEPGETKNVTVVSSLSGTMRCPSGYSSIGMTHTYTYLSNPAKNWVEFAK